MSDFRLQEGIRYRMRNGVIIDGVTRRHLGGEIIPEDVSYPWVCIGPIEYEGTTYTGEGRFFTIGESASDLVEALDHFVATPEKSLSELIAEAEPVIMTVPPNPTIEVSGIDVHLVTDDGTVFETNVPLPLIEDIGVIIYKGQCFVYQHRSTFVSTPRFVGQRSIDMSNASFAQVSE